jgi:ketosteroid isomerase-like protein
LVSEIHICLVDCNLLHLETINLKQTIMKKLLILLIAGVMAVACSNGKHAEFEKNTEAAKAYFKLHESENAEEMFTYLSEDLTWHMPAYGMGIGGTEEVKAAILWYQAAFDNMVFTADYWLPGVDTETGVPDGSTRVYGTWTSVYAETGQELSLTSYHSFEFKDGKIINGGDWFDLGGMMNSLVPAPVEVIETETME